MAQRDRAQYMREYRKRHKEKVVKDRQVHQACDAEIAKLKAELRVARGLIEQYRKAAW